MIRVLFTIQSDVCGDLFDQLRDSQQSDPQDWCFEAGDVQETSGTNGWCFNPKNRRHWCRTAW